MDRVEKLVEMASTVTPTEMDEQLGVLDVILAEGIKHSIKEERRESAQLSVGVLMGLFQAMHRELYEIGREEADR